MSAEQDYVLRQLSTYLSQIESPTISVDVIAEGARINAITMKSLIQKLCTLRTIIYGNSRGSRIICPEYRIDINMTGWQSIGASKISLGSVSYSAYQALQANRIPVVWLEGPIVDSIEEVRLHIKFEDMGLDANALERNAITRTIMYIRCVNRNILITEEIRCRSGGSVDYLKRLTDSIVDIRSYATAQGFINDCHLEITNNQRSEEDVNKVTN